MCVLAYQPTMPNGSRSPMERWIAVLDAFTTRDDWGVRELASDGSDPSWPGSPS